MNRKLGGLELILLLIFVLSGCSDSIVKEASGMVSDNADLVEIVLSHGSLVPAFAPGILSYLVEVPNATSSIGISGTPEDDRATLVYEPGQFVSLDEGDNIVSLTVTSEDKTTSKQYRITVDRSPDFSSTLTFNSESYPGAHADWSVTNNGWTVTQQFDTPEATFGLLGLAAFDATYRFRAGVMGSSDDDFFGFALGFEPGETGFGAATNYLVISWKRLDQTDARRGLALLHVQGGAPTGTHGNNPLWTYAVSPAFPVTVLCWANTRADAGWSSNTLYDWTIRYRTDSLSVSIDGLVEFDVPASDWPQLFPGGFPDGQIVYYAFSQPGAQFTIAQW